jgi:hypothetical protein
MRTADRSTGGIRGVVLLGLLDVAVAALIAVLVVRVFGVSSVAETDPPVCYDASGGIVSCSLTPSLLLVPTFAIVPLGLGLWQALRHRSRCR